MTASHPVPIENPLAITDQDLCSTCVWLDARPSSRCYCTANNVTHWPCVLDEDGYASSCEEYKAWEKVNDSI